MGGGGGLSFDSLSITIPVTTKYVLFVYAIDFPLYFLTQSLGELGQLRARVQKTAAFKTSPSVHTDTDVAAFTGDSPKDVRVLVGSLSLPMTSAPEIHKSTASIDSVFVTSDFNSVK